MHPALQPLKCRQSLINLRLVSNRYLIVADDERIAICEGHTLVDDFQGPIAPAAVGLGSAPLGCLIVQTVA